MHILPKRVFNGRSIWIWIVTVRVFPRKLPRIDFRGMNQIHCSNHYMRKKRRRHFYRDHFENGKHKGKRSLVHQRKRCKQFFIAIQKSTSNCRLLKKKKSICNNLQMKSSRLYVAHILNIAQVAFDLMTLDNCQEYAIPQKKHERVRETTRQVDRQLQDVQMTC